MLLLLCVCKNVMLLCDINKCLYTIVIDRGNACACDIAVADLISDHHAVHCHLAMRKPPSMVKYITYRKIRAIVICF